MSGDGWPRARKAAREQRVRERREAKALRKERRKTERHQAMDSGTSGSWEALRVALEQRDEQAERR